MVAAAPALDAQVSTASIYGTVRDSSGASIPGAALTLHNVATGVDVASGANGAGEYAMVNIQPGTYDLRVSKPGFQSSLQRSIVLAVNQTLRDEPERVNQDPYGAGWMIRVGLGRPDEVDALLDAEGYRAFVATEQKR